MASGIELFGSTEELISFAKIFLGSLVVSLLYFLIKKKMSSIPLPGEKQFDWTVLVLGMWCFTGMSIDAWGHKHGEVNDSFFTPWHAIWYSGFTAFAGFITYSLLRLHDGPLPRSPASVKRFLASMPAGYGVGVAGMVVFSLAGFGDMLWHTFLGIEGGTDILLSTTHLGLAAGLALSLMTPFWAAWHVEGSGEEGLSSQLPMIFGLAGAWSVLTLFTSYIHPQTISFYDICSSLPQCPENGAGLEKGVSAILLQSAILSGVVMLYLRRWKPDFGAFTILLGFNGIAIAAFAPGDLGVAWKHIVAPLLAGLVIDLAYWKLQPDSSRKLKIFAFIVPALQTIIWMLTLLYQTGWQYVVVGGYPVMSPLGWTVHATFGAIFLAGSVGVLMSIVTDPPNNPKAKDSDSQTSS
jgi:hypothetical protein